MEKMRIQQRVGNWKVTKQIRELKNTITALKDSLEGFSNKIDKVEESIRKLEDRSFGNISSESQNRNKKLINKAKNWREHIGLTV